MENALFSFLYCYIPGLEWCALSDRPKTSNSPSSCKPEPLSVFSKQLNTMGRWRSSSRYVRRCASALDAGPGPGPGLDAGLLQGCTCIAISGLCVVVRSLA